MYVTLPHIGLVNADHIRATRISKAEWRSHGTRWWKVKAGRKRRVGAKPWRTCDGKWHRPNDWWDGGRSYHKASLLVYFQGLDYPNEIEFGSTARAQRAMEELDAALQALRANGVERIVAAAIRRMERYKGDVPTAEQDVWVTYTRPAPARHHHILHWMPGDARRVQQGFLTSTGRYVSRQEAMGIAVTAGQVPPSKVTAPDLFSEDVW